MVPQKGTVGKLHIAIRFMVLSIALWPLIPFILNPVAPVPIPHAEWNLSFFAAIIGGLLITRMLMPIVAKWCGFRQGVKAGAISMMMFMITLSTLFYLWNPVSPAATIDEQLKRLALATVWMGVLVGSGAGFGLAVFEITWRRSS